MLENFVAKIWSDFALSSSWILFPFFFFFSYSTLAQRIYLKFFFSPVMWKKICDLVSLLMDQQILFSVRYVRCLNSYLMICTVPSRPSPPQPRGPVRVEGCWIVYHNHTSQLKVIFMLFICLKIITAICLKSQEVFQ